MKVFKVKLSKKLLAVCATVAVVMTTATVNCFAEGTGTTTTVGVLPDDVKTQFSNLATGLVATIAAVAGIAILVFAAPQAVLMAKKIFKKVSG